LHGVQAGADSPWAESLSNFVMENWVQNPHYQTKQRRRRRRRREENNTTPPPPPSPPQQQQQQLTTIKQVAAAFFGLCFQPMGTE